VSLKKKNSQNKAVELILISFKNLASGFDSATSPALTLSESSRELKTDKHK
jgi:hypothetical protein